MSSKRKRPAPKRTVGKRYKRKEESDLDSDLSDSSGNEHATQPDEVLIAGHGDVLDEPTQLPQELLKTLIKPAGQLIVFGAVNWDSAGKKENKTSKRAQSNLYTPHLFTNLKVKYSVAS